MIDEIKTDSNEVPEGDTSITSEIEKVTATPDVSTGPVTEEDFEKIDTSKLTPEELKSYKHFQAKYTKARQKDKEGFKPLQDKAAFLDNLLADKEIYNRAYSKFYGQPAPEQTSNSEEYIDPVVKKLSALENSVREMSIERAGEVINSFKNSLGKESSEQFEKLEPQMTRIVGSMRDSNFTPIEKLQIAWNHLTVSNAYQRGRKDILAEFQKKKNIVSPETNSNATSVVHSKEKQTMEEAFAAAERIEESKLGR